MISLLPFAYSFSSRIKSLFNVTSFILTYVLPIYLVANYLSKYSGGSVKDFNFIFILSFAAVFLIYEIGYLYNDVYTVRFEKNPTIRMSKFVFEFADRNFPLLISARLIVLYVLLFKLAQLLSFEQMSRFSLSLSLLYISYSFHNCLRGNVNLITIFFVVSFKYLSILSIWFSGQENILIIFAFIFTVPMLRALLFTSHNRFTLFYKIDKNNVDYFRIGYLALMLIVFCFLSVLMSALKIIVVVLASLLTFYILFIFVKRIIGPSNE